MNHAELSKVIYEEGLMANYPGRIDDFYKGIAERIAVAVEKHGAVKPVVASLPSEQEMRDAYMVVNGSCKISAMSAVHALIASRVSVATPADQTHCVLCRNTADDFSTTWFPGDDRPGVKLCRTCFNKVCPSTPPTEPPISMKCVSCQKESSFTREQVEKFPIVCTPECHRQFYAADPPDRDATRKKMEEVLKRAYEAERAYIRECANVVERKPVEIDEGELAQRMIRTHYQGNESGMFKVFARAAKQYIEEQLGVTAGTREFYAAHISDSDSKVDYRPDAVQSVAATSGPSAERMPPCVAIPPEPIAEALIRVIGQAIPDPPLVADAILREFPQLTAKPQTPDREALAKVIEDAGIPWGRGVFTAEWRESLVTAILAAFGPIKLRKWPTHNEWCDFLRRQLPFLPDDARKLADALDAKLSDLAVPDAGQGAAVFKNRIPAPDCAHCGTPYGTDFVTRSINGKQQPVCPTCATKLLDPEYHAADATRKKANELASVFAETEGLPTLAPRPSDSPRKGWLVVAAHVDAEVRAAKREAYAAAKQIAFSNADYESTQAIRDLMDALDTEKPK